VIGQAVECPPRSSLAVIDEDALRGRADRWQRPNRVRAALGRIESGLTSRAIRHFTEYPLLRSHRQNAGNGHIAVRFTLLIAILFHFFLAGGNELFREPRRRSVCIQ